MGALFYMENAGGKFISAHRRGGYDPPAFYVFLSPRSLGEQQGEPNFIDSVTDLPPL